MPIPSSLSITSSPAVVETPPSSATISHRDTTGANTSHSDSGSDAASHQGEDSRSIIRKHISFRPRSASPPSQKKGHFLGFSGPSSDHVSLTHSNTESTPKSAGSNPLRKFRSRSRGLSGSSLLNPNIKISSVSRENLPLQSIIPREGAEYHRDRQTATLGGSAASADNSSLNLNRTLATPQLQQSSSCLVVDHSFISTTTTQPPLPQFHSRQRVPSRHDLLTANSVTDLRNCTLADRHLVDQPRSKSPAMALKFLSGHGSGGSSTSIKHFDIRLDNDYIVFRGSEDEAASAQLAGSVVLCLTEPLNISHIQLTLSGIVHMSWQATSASSMSGRKHAYKEQTFFEKSWPFKVAGKDKSLMLMPDNYEWPFDTILEGSLPESVEGLKDAWIIYRLKAEIGRKRAKDIVVRKPLRIVRTLDPSALELAHAMSVENIWPNKIEYSISVPSKAIIFGSFLRVDFKLIPLLKGLVIGQISTQVREEQEFIVDPEWGISALGGGQTKHDRVIASDLYTIDAEKDEQIIDEAAEGFQFSRFLELPKSLHQCLQDCNVKGIKVRHKVKFNVQLHNPDGHISELRANLPVAFYISPNLPINENNDVVDQSPQASRAAVENDMNNCAPPLYGEHMLDKLYSEVDPSGYLTPAVGLSTPGTPYLHSRQPSSENLHSLDAIASSQGTSGFNTPDGGFVNPAALHHRLQNLDLTLGGPSRDPHHQSHDDGGRRDSDPEHADGYFSPHDSAANATHDSSGILSRRESEEGNGTPSGARTPFPQYAHMEDLARVPSYSTAVKAPAPHSSTAGLPTYGAAMTNGEIETPSLPEPPSVHLRDARGGLGRSPPQNRNLSYLQDGERRLRLMQMRGR